MNSAQIIERWSAFQALAHLKCPESEADYERLSELVDHLLSNYDFESEPYATLLDIASGYMESWEEAHFAISTDDITPAQVLAHLMEAHGLSQSDLAREGVAQQSDISKALSGERDISKGMAKRLGERFKVDAGLFL